MSMGIEAVIEGAPQNVVKAIQNASRQTGVNFDYLVNQARTESSFKVDAKASTSSATGLYQFIDQTWLATVSKHGSKHGLSQEAESIQRDFQGRYFIADGTQKDHIMTLRNNPNVASLMAAEFALDNQAFLEQKLDRDITGTDLYFAHFLGAGGASQFLSKMDQNPNQAAALILKTAAQSNKNVFYNSDGSMKSLKQIYNHFEGKFMGSMEVQTANFAPADSIQNTYKRDLSFERMYGNHVDEFIAQLPSLNPLTGAGFFDTMMHDLPFKSSQNQFIDPSLFLTLTMLDTSK